ncbi:MAG: DJ-1/PfpI family protein [Moraxella sp.]
MVLPGGGANADVLRANTDAQAMVKAFMNVGKPVAAICHAPWIFAYRNCPW